MSGCGAVWLARYLGVVEVAGSSPVTPTMLFLCFYFFINNMMKLTKHDTVTAILLCFIEV